MTKAQEFMTAANQQQVCRLLGWTMEQYTEYQYEQGLVYLREKVCGDEWSVEKVSQSTMYWRWWVNHWNTRDAEFVTAARLWPLSWLKRKYEDLNEVDGFEFWPHKAIMMDTYEHMIYQATHPVIA